MFLVNNSEKSYHLKDKISTDKFNSGNSLNYTYCIAICKCTGDVDCNEMFEVDVCGGSAYSDADTGKCHCVMF